MQMGRSSGLSILAALVFLAAPARTAEPEISERGKDIRATELDGPGLARDWGSLFQQLKAVGLQAEFLVRFVTVPRFDSRVSLQSVLEKVASANACELTWTGGGQGAVLWRKASGKDEEFVSKHILGGDPAKFSEAIIVAAITEDLTVFRGLLAAVGKMNGAQKTEVIGALVENHRLGLAAALDRASCLALCTHALTVQDSSLRSSATTALGRLGGGEALGLLKTAVKDPHLQVRIRAVDSLTCFGQPGASRLLREAAEDTNAEVRANAIGALVLRGDPGALDLLEAAFGDADRDLRSRVIRYLHLLDRQSALKLAGKALGDPEKGNRSFALRALGLMGGPEIRDMLLDRFKAEPEAYLRETAARILWARFPNDEIVRRTLGEKPAKNKPPPLELGPVAPEIF